MDKKFGFIGVRDRTRPGGLIHASETQVTERKKEFQRTFPIRGDRFENIAGSVCNAIEGVVNGEFDEGRVVIEDNPKDKGFYRVRCDSKPLETNGVHRLMPGGEFEGVYNGAGFRQEVLAFIARLGGIRPIEIDMQKKGGRFYSFRVYSVNGA